MLKNGLSSAIAAIRLRKGMKQEDAAHRAGVDPSNWSKWETGERHPQQRQLEKITTGLGCDEIELGLEASRQCFEHYRERALEVGAEVEALAPQQVVDRIAQLDVERLPKELRPSIRSLRDGITQLGHQLTDLYQLLIDSTESESTGDGLSDRL